MTSDPDNGADKSTNAIDAEQLEAEKLRLEVRELERRWFLRPDYLRIVVSVVIASIAALITYQSGVLDKQRLQIEIKSIEAEKANYEDSVHVLRAEMGVLRKEKLQEQENAIIWENQARQASERAAALVDKIARSRSVSPSHVADELGLSGVPIVLGTAVSASGLQVRGVNFGNTLGLLTVELLFRAEYDSYEQAVREEECTPARFQVQSNFSVGWSDTLISILPTQLGKVSFERFVVRALVQCFGNAPYAPVSTRGSKLLLKRGRKAEATVYLSGDELEQLGYPDKRHHIWIN